VGSFGVERVYGTWLEGCGRLGAVLVDAVQGGGPDGRHVRGARWLSQYGADGHEKLRADH
jgi:hypothetical protein